MGNLDKFKVVTSNSERPFVSVTENGVSFSKTAMEMLGFPEHVLLMVNEADRQFAVQASEKSAHTQPFVKPGKDRSAAFVRWSNKKVIGPLLEMLPDSAATEGLRINGNYSDEDDCIIFDCSDTEKIIQRKIRTK